MFFCITLNLSKGSTRHLIVPLKIAVYVGAEYNVAFKNFEIEYS